MAMGYEEIKELISETLANRPKGTEITPETHQELEMQLLEYIRSIELSSNAPFIDIATADTDPVQPDDSRVCYIATLSPSERVTFTNFHGQDGRAITITASTFQSCIVFLIWNTAYWESKITTLSSLGKVTSEGGEIFNDYVNNKANQYGHAEGTNTEATGIQGCHSEGNTTKAQGDSSHSEGLNTIASGFASHAENNQTKAQGLNSHAEGYNTTASGQQGHAEGCNTVASGNHSHAEGDTSTASEQAAHAEGYRCEASGQQSHAEGSGSIASGNQSHAEGHQCEASGQASHAEGYLTTSDHNNAHAEGYQTAASGEQSHAEGFSCQTQANNAHAEGDTSIASGFASHAEGYHTQSQGNSSHSEGADTIAVGDNSHSEGNTTKASGQQSHAEGYQTQTQADSSHAEGDTSIASGYASHAEGYHTQSQGNSSHSEGAATIASGDNSHSEGNSTKAQGLNSHAEGHQCEASGQASHAEGRSSIASGDDSHAEGYQCEATGRATHAEGYLCKATHAGAHAGGEYSQANGMDSFAHGYQAIAQRSSSVAMGDRTIADNYYQFSIGSRNTEDSAPSPSGDLTKPFFVIGNGIAFNQPRSDAFKVLGNGTVYADNTTIQPMADYAEMFEWLDGNPDNEDRVGYIVALSGNRIIKATGKANELIIGIISGAPTIIGDAPMRWKNKYLVDEWGRPIYEEIEQEIEVPYEVIEKQEREISRIEKIYVKNEDGQIQTDENGNPILEERVVTETVEVEVSVKKMRKETIKTKTRKLNPDYNSEAVYVPREQRPEWSAVGLLGKVLVRQDGTLKAGEYCRPNENGVATKSDGGFYVLEVISETQAKVLVK